MSHSHNSIFQHTTGENVIDNLRVAQEFKVGRNVLAVRAGQRGTEALMTMKGIPNQTNDLFKVQLNDGTDMFSITAAGLMDFEGNRVTNIADPTEDQDAATKAYVSSVTGGIKGAVRVATTAAATLTSDFENGDTVDGVILVTGDRILIKNQGDATENGIYTVNASGAPTRAIDFDTGNSVAGAYMPVQEGTTNADRLFICSSDEPNDVVGTDTLTFILLSGHIAGDGLVETGGGAALAVNVDGTTIEISGDTVRAASTLAGTGLTMTGGGGNNIDIDAAQPTITSIGQAAQALTLPGDVSVTDATSATSTTTGALKVTGGISTQENLYVGGDAVITGDLTVSGTTTTVESATTTFNDNLVVYNSGPGSTKDSGFLIDRFQDPNNSSAGDVIADTAAETSAGHGGNAQAGSSTTITLNAGASASDDAYNDWWIHLTGGTGSGQVRRIKDYVGATNVATIYADTDGAPDGDDFDTAPDGTTTYSLYNRPLVGVLYDEDVDTVSFVATASDPGATQVTIQDYVPIHAGGATFDDAVTISDATNATNKDTGALIIAAGGLGVEQDVHVGGSLDVADRINDIYHAGTTAEITAQLAVISGAGGGTLHIAPGDYTASTAFTVPSNTRVKGAGYITHITNDTTNTWEVAAGASNVVIEEMRLSGSAAADIANVSIADCDKFILRRLWITAARQGIETSDNVATNDKCVIRDCFISGQTLTTELIGLFNCTNMIITENRLDSPGTSTRAIFMNDDTGSRDCIISNNQIIGAFDDGIRVTGVNQLIEGNMFDGCATGIELNDADRCTVGDNTFLALVATNYGIFQNTNSIQCNFSDNIIAGSAGTGIQVAGSSTLVEGNTMTGLTVGLDFTNASMTNCSIVGNQCVSCTTDYQNSGGFDSNDDNVFESNQPLSETMALGSGNVSPSLFTLESVASGINASRTGTLADGLFKGQRKIIRVDSYTSDEYTLTVTSGKNEGTIVFDAEEESVELVWDGDNWYRGDTGHDITFPGTVTFSGATTIDASQIIDVDSAEAFLVRKDGDPAGGDVLTVDTTSTTVTVGNTNASQSDVATLTITGNDDAILNLIADVDDAVAETHNALINFSQDGGTVTGLLGLNSSNEFVLDATGASGPLTLSTDGTARLSIDVTAGDTTITSATNSSSKDTGALVLTAGGMGVEQDVFVGGLINVTDRINDIYHASTTAEITSQLAAIGTAGGGTLIIAPGTYTVTDTAPVDSVGFIVPSNCRIIGAGRETHLDSSATAMDIFSCAASASNIHISHLRASAADGWCLMFPGTSLTNFSMDRIEMEDTGIAYCATASGSDLSFTNCRFTGTNQALNINSPPNGIVVDHCYFSGNTTSFSKIEFAGGTGGSNYRISNCFFDTITTTGNIITLTNDATNLIVDNCIFESCSMTTGTSIIRIDSDDVIVSNCVFDNCSIATTGTAIVYVSSSSNVTVTDCKFQTCAVSTFDVVQFSTCADSKVVGCTFDACTTNNAIRYLNGSTGLVSGCTIANGATVTGVHLSTCPNSAITGCVITDCTSEGISSNSLNCSITGNNATDCGVGIELAAGGDDNVVSGNKTFSCTTGFSINNSATNCLVTGNDFSGNTTDTNVSTSSSQTGRFHSNLSEDVLTLAVASASTIILNPITDTFNVTGTTTVNSITAGYDGRKVTLIFDSTANVAHLAGNVHLLGDVNFVPVASDTLTLVCDGTTWFEAGRSASIPVAAGGTGATSFTDNRLLTGNGTSAINDEANLTFDGTTLTVAGQADIEGYVALGNGSALDQYSTLKINRNMTVADANSGFALEIPSQTFTATASATHSTMALVALGTLTVGDPGTNPTITNAATVYIQDAPTLGGDLAASVSNGPYSIFVASGNSRFDGSVLTSSIDTDTAGTLTLGPATATKIEIADSGVITEVQGSLTVEGSIDTLAAVTLTLGPATATRVEIAKNGVVTEVQGTLDVVEAATFQSTVTADELDTTNATTLLLGKATATRVEIAKNGVVTEVQGTLDVAEAATFQSTIAGDELDSLNATTLLIGKATATKVEIADDGVDTEIKGSLSVHTADAGDDERALTITNSDSGGATSIGMHLRPSVGASNDNGGGRLHFDESGDVGEDGKWGFSVGYNGGPASALLNWDANSFNIARHNNDATGEVVIRIDRTSSIVNFSGTVATNSVDTEAVESTLTLGPAIADRVEIAKNGVVTEVQGTLDVVEAATFQSTIAGDELDSLNNATLFIGKATATKVEIADTGIVTEVQGPLTVDDIDAVSGTLLLGKATATKIELADAGVETEVQGTLDVVQTSEFQDAVAIGTTADTNANLLILKPITASFESTPSHLRTGGTITTFTSGVHGIASSLLLSSPTITSGGATTTTSATLYIAGAPIGTGTGISNNDAIHVAGGSTFLGGTLNIKETSTEALLIENGSSADEFTVDTSANIVKAHNYFGVNSDPSADRPIRLNYTTTHTSGGNSGVLIQGTITGDTDGSFSAVDITPSGSITAGSGDVANVDSLLVREPVITEGTNTVLRASTLRIESAPTEGNDNYALLVDSGETHLDGDLTVDGDFENGDDASVDWDEDFTTSVATVVRVRKLGPVVWLEFEEVTGTSNKATFAPDTFTVPDGFMPQTATVYFPALVEDNDVDQMGLISVDTSGNIVVYPTANLDSAATWTTSGTKTLRKTCVQYTVA